MFMSEEVKETLLVMFEHKMGEISKANAKLRRWMYGLILIFGIGLLSAMYWAGAMNQKVNAMTDNVAKITKQVDRMEAKYNDIVWFMVSEFKYEPTQRGTKGE